MQSQIEYNQEWTETDMLAFNGHVIDEKVVSCKWMHHGVPCNVPIKGINFSVHLHDTHGVTSDLQSYQCQWDACPTRRPMKKTSLERHLIEQHVPVDWACPYENCVQTFTRKSTLLAHIERSHEHA